MKLFLFLLLICGPLLAGNEIGNGGNTVRGPCENKWYFYDVYEMGLLYQWNVVLPPETNSEIAIAKGILARLNTIDPELTQQLQLYAERFYTHAIFNHNTLSRFEDYDTIYLEEGSRLYQLINQRNAITCGFECSRYEISYPLWQQLDKVQKAAAIVHEILYKRALINHPKLRRSDDIRFLNQILLADKLEDTYQFVVQIYLLYLSKDPIREPSLNRAYDEAVRTFFPPRCSLKE